MPITDLESLSSILKNSFGSEVYTSRFKTFDNNGKITDGDIHQYSISISHITDVSAAMALDFIFDADENLSKIIIPGECIIESLRVSNAKIS